MVEQEPVPVYFNQEESIGQGMFCLSTELLERNNIAMQPVTPWVRYYYVNDFGDLYADNFSLETALRNTFRKGSGACGESKLIVMCENNVFVIPLSIPGCASALNAYLPGKELKGSLMDLSALGVDYNNWVKLRLQVKDKAVQVFVNDKLALNNTFSANAGKVVGLFYRFQGSGAVDYVYVWDDKSGLVFKDEF